MKVKKIINNDVFIVGIMVIISIIIVTFNKKIEAISILNDDFLITFLLYMFGFALTVSAILYSFVEKINYKIESMEFEEKKSSNILKILKHLLKELKDDTLLILALLILIIFISLFKDIDFPKISFGYKSELLYFVKIMSIFLSSYSIRDIVLTVFRILNINYK